MRTRLLTTAALLTAAAWADQNCTGSLANVTIKDNLHVNAAANCTLNNVTITGNVSAQNAGDLAFTAVHIGGSLNSEGARSLLLLGGSTVDHDIVVGGTFAVPPPSTRFTRNTICNTTVGHNLNLHDNMAPFALGWFNGCPAPGSVTTGHDALIQSSPFVVVNSLMVTHDLICGGTGPTPATQVGVGVGGRNQCGVTQPGPVQTVSNDVFNQMVASGNFIPITSALLASQDQMAAATQLQDQATVDAFIQQNPNLTGFATIVDASPSNPNVHPTDDGNFVFDSPDNAGVVRTIKTLGQASKLAMLADSIRSSSDPVQQLALYQSFYSHYMDLYQQNCVTISDAATVISPKCTSLTPPSQLVTPASLANSPLPAVQSALATLGSMALQIIKIPPLVSGVPLPCGLEAGASSVADNILFGDQTSSNPICKTPSPYGILGNFNWLNKNLLSCVKEQGKRGSCHIFGSTSAMEEVIARDTGLIVNLSEQDFMEREKLIWGRAFYGDKGNPGTDLGNAASHNYKFAWEYQWDYNPALSQPKPPAYEYTNTCQNYPYPSLEPGCSNSAPESPQTCTWTTVGGLVIRVCGFTPAVLSGARSPYMATAPSQIWNPSNPGLSFANIILSLTFNNAVVLGFNVSDNFKNDAPGGYVYYDPADIADKKNYHGSHVVHVVGFVSNADLAANPATQFAPGGAGGGYLVIKNSWGACSGDAGYMYMPVSYFEATANGVYVVSSETH